MENNDFLKMRENNIFAFEIWLKCLEKQKLCHFVIVQTEKKSVCVLRDIH